MWQPMLLSEAPAAFDHAEWIWQLKWDGIRCGVDVEKGQIRLFSRNGKEMTDKFPEVLADLRDHIRGLDALLDGELVCLTTGKPDFYAVMSRLQGSSDKAKHSANRTPATFMAFDILRARNKDCTRVALVERQSVLADYVQPSDHVQLVESWPGTSGLQASNAVADMGLEGIVGKRKLSLYRPGMRTKDWVKVKFWQRTEVVILGVREKPFSAIVGNDHGRVLCSVSLGLTAAHHAELWNAIPHLRLRVEDGVTWVRPVLRGRLRYRTSPTGAIREPVFEGFLVDGQP